jgi:hypothetical protein
MKVTVTSSNCRPEYQSYNYASLSIDWSLVLTGLWSLAELEPEPTVSHHRAKPDGPHRPAVKALLIDKLRVCHTPAKMLDCGAVGVCNLNLAEAIPLDRGRRHFTLIDHPA